MPNSVQKGKRLEREVSALMRGFGYEARRARQYQGVVEDPNSADIVHNIPNLRIEAKGGYNKEELWTSEVKGWIAKAKESINPGENWVILWRRDYKQWECIYETPEGIIVKTNQVDSVLGLFGGSLAKTITNQ